MDNEELLAKWWSKVDRTTTPDGCWPWKGAAHPYGEFYERHRVCHSAHRWGYEHLVGPIPEGMVVRHSCDNPPCCRPDHLLVGTQADNAHDMVVRGRQYTKPMPGAENGRAKLTWPIVNEIRRRHAEGESQTALAQEYQVSQPNVGLIVRGMTWKIH